MTNLTHAYMNEIGIPSVIESSVVQIKSSQLARPMTTSKSVTCNFEVYHMKVDNFWSEEAILLSFTCSAMVLKILCILLTVCAQLVDYMYRSYFRNKHSNYYYFFFMTLMSLEVFRIW